MGSKLNNPNSVHSHTLTKNMVSGIFMTKRPSEHIVEDSRKSRTPAVYSPKIEGDHISVLVYTPLNLNTNQYEYFLELIEPSHTYTLLGIQQKTPGEAWKPALEKFFQGVGVAIKPAGLIRLDRWFSPHVERMPAHAVYGVVVKNEMKTSISHAFSGTWMTQPDVLQCHRDRQLFSPDVLEIIVNSNVGTLGVPGTEITSQQVFIDLQSGRNEKLGFDTVVQAAKFGLLEQELLYKEFLFYTLPFLHMGWAMFSSFMKKLGWRDAILPDLFRSFDLDNKGGLSFRDFLYGLAATEPATQHGGPPAEIRCRYIFRFYDQNGDGKLNFEELKLMITDMRVLRGQPSDSTSIQREAEKSAKLFGDAWGDNLGLSEFLTAVGQLKFRGTSHLLRSPTSAAIYLQTGVHAQGSTALQVPVKRSKMEFNGFNTDLTHLEKNATNKYDIATHSVRVRKSGTVLDIHSLWDIEHSGMFGQTDVQRPSLGPSATRTQSFDRFNQESKPNEMLNGLRYFEKMVPIDSTSNSNYGSKPAFDWGEVDRSSLSKSIISLCEQVRDILFNEPRLLEIEAPCYILGDIHGNFPDLICFEKALWRLGPIVTPATILFLGDYVDRGIYGVEVVSYLFAQKILAPTKFNLLRGNHEMRDVQLMFTFFKECVTKFGEKDGRDVWEAVNSAFDCMPLAAIVDKKVFCVHGGIPPPWLGDGTVSLINSIPCPLNHPEEQSQLSWELMWSDPIHLELIPVEERTRLSIVDGFATNVKRGTAHVFTEDALECFLVKNNLSHVVRAHEVQQAGFQVQLGGKLLTVFSSSKYCGGSNEAACILADKYKLRTIRIDTT